MKTDLTNIHPRDIELVREIDRELAARLTTYERLINDRKLDRDTANRQYLSLQFAKMLLTWSSGLYEFSTGGYTITIPNAVAEVRREMKMRQKLYPAFIRGGSLTQVEAGRRLGLFQQLLDRLEPMLPKPTGDGSVQGELFK